MYVSLLYKKLFCKYFYLQSFFNFKYYNCFNLKKVDCFYVKPEVCRILYFIPSVCCHNVSFYPQKMIKLVGLLSYLYATPYVPKDKHLFDILFFGCSFPITIFL